ncbi:MAG: hypothetical protein HFF39_08480 [Lawsonibacter sp.]|nr:hypothetical protein [Lawsonibacter sp.]
MYLLIGIIPPDLICSGADVTETFQTGFRHPLFMYNHNIKTLGVKHVFCGGDYNEKAVVKFSPGKPGRNSGEKREKPPQFWKNRGGFAENAGNQSKASPR